MDEKTIARFWAKVDKNGPVPAHRPELGPCWIWTGYVSTGKDGGYGQFRVGRRVEKAHRVAMQVDGVALSDRLALHRCDNRRCVRREHLFEGTNADNNRDMISKGRDVKVRGEAHGLSKLTEADVREIRERHALGDGLLSISRDYGVVKQAIWAVVKRRVWSHVA